MPQKAQMSQQTGKNRQKQQKYRRQRPFERAQHIQSCARARFQFHFVLGGGAKTIWPATNGKNTNKTFLFN